MPLAVSSLLEEDLAQVTLIERACYSDNLVLRDGVVPIAKTFQAAAARNQLKRFPSLSFKTNLHSQLIGYLVAFQEPFPFATVSEEYQNRIYIADFAVTHRPSVLASRAAAMLISAFIRCYSENYVCRANPLPVIADARCSTSGKLIERKLAYFARRAGLRARLINHKKFMMGHDEMSRIIILPIDNDLP